MNIDLNVNQEFLTYDYKLFIANINLHGMFH